MQQYDFVCRDVQISVVSETSEVASSSLHSLAFTSPYSSGNLLAIVARLGSWYRLSSMETRLLKPVSSTTDNGWRSVTIIFSMASSIIFRFMESLPVGVTYLPILDQLYTKCMTACDFCYKVSKIVLSLPN